MFIHHRRDDIDEFFFVPYEFRIHEDIIHRDIVGKLDMFFRFIVGKNISSLGFERCLAYVLLIEEIVIMIMSKYLEIEQSQYKNQKK